MIRWQSLSAKEKNDTLARPAMANRADLSAAVDNIIQQVKTNGDQTLLDLTLKFDGLNLESVALPAAKQAKILATLGTEQKEAIELAYGQIKRFHEAQVANDVRVETTQGVTCELLTAAIASVGLYIPGGSAPLPSTVLMLGVPAQIAGCQRVVLCTPPDTSVGNEGGITAEILYAAKICGITEIYRVGGAQAIAALAYGTDSIAPVDKIYGPGNSFVTEAKQQVAQDPAGAAIDMPAGPSEVLVLADEYANPEFVAADLLSQAEHGPDSQTILVSDSEDLISKTKTAIESQLELLPRAEIAQKALANSRFILATSLDEAIEISNQYAPEHLIVQVENARQYLPKLKNAASIFLGAYTPESAGDYASGTNHVLPTYGYSKVLSSLSLIDFTRRFTVQEITPQGLQNIGPAIMTLAAAEGLDAHKNAVKLRLEELETLQDEQGSLSAFKAETSVNPLIDKLIRPELKTLKPYESARRLFSMSSSSEIETMWLNANENPSCPNVSTDPSLFNRYPDFQPEPLVKAYADYAKVNTNQLLATRGADEGIELLIRTFAKPGQAITICPPTYGMYAISAETAGVNVLRAPLKPDMQLDVEATIKATKRANITFICSPNNPTGNVINRSDLEAVLNATKDQSIVVADEAYIEFCSSASVVDLLSRYDNLVILRTMSKAFGLAGIRCGFVLANEPVIDALKKVIAPYPVPAPVAQVASQALSREGLDWMKQCVSDINRRRQDFIEFAEQSKCVEHVFPSATNFVLLRLSPRLNVDNAMQQFIDDHVLVRNQSKQLNLTNTLRVTIGNDLEMVKVTNIFKKLEAQLDKS